jgi:hypothetical protein
MLKRSVLRNVSLWVSMGVLLASAPFAGEKGQAPPPARKIPGITAQDRYPNACVDCHINYAEIKLDTRFSTLMRRWTEKVDPQVLAKAQASAPKGVVLRGKHPGGNAALGDIPGKCLVCHRKGSTATPPFASLIHSLHLTGGEENHFLTLFQGECTHCHKLEMATGRWTIPSAPER